VMPDLSEAERRKLASTSPHAFRHTVGTQMLAAGVTRAALAWLPADDDTPASWLLEVIGKGNKQRFVPISDACVDALRAHWRDRGEAFDAAGADRVPGSPLVAPLVLPPTPRAREKFGVEVDADTEGKPTKPGGYSVRGARGLTQWAITQLLKVMPDLSEAERRKLASTSPHAFRHTVGTQMLAAGVALEVVQRTLGHASLGTTSIYVSPEETRLRREAAKYHARLDGSAVAPRAGVGYDGGKSGGERGGRGLAR